MFGPSLRIAGSWCNDEVLVVLAREPRAAAARCRSWTRCLMPVASVGLLEALAGAGGAQRGQERAELGNVQSMGSQGVDACGEGCGGGHGDEGSCPVCAKGGA